MGSAGSAAAGRWPRLSRRRQVLGTSLAAATKIGWTDAIQQITEPAERAPRSERGPMIIQLEGLSQDHTHAAGRGLGAIAQNWGTEITPMPATAAATSHRDNGKAIDPTSLATFVLSIPPAALAALDLADRIRKRRRAAELIDHAQQLATQQIIVHLITRDRAIELRTLTPDQLLELAAEDTAS